MVGLLHIVVTAGEFEKRAVPGVGEAYFATFKGNSSATHSMIIADIQLAMSDSS